jgi:hypothetical protein
MKLSVTEIKICSDISKKENKVDISEYVGKLGIDFVYEQAVQSL